MERKLFEASEEFATLLFRMVERPLFDDSARGTLSHVAASLALEHWVATRRLLSMGMLPSAAVVHRAQFEATLRSIWILYAASDEQIGKLGAGLSLDSEQAAKNMPQVAAMISALKARAPSQAYDAMNRFKENAWSALNSYAHAGIHPLTRHAERIPVQLVENLVKIANALAIVAAMQAAILSGIPLLQREILNLATLYPDCLPPPM